MQIIIDIPESIIRHIRDGSYGARPYDKPGRWIDVPIGRYVLLHRCSNCLQCSDKASKYCPCCGAKMMEEENG